MPFINTDEPFYPPNNPVFLNQKKLDAFHSFVASCHGGSGMEEDKFRKLMDTRWRMFASGAPDNESTLMLDILMADRLGFDVDLRELYERWLGFLAAAKAAEGKG